MCDPSGAEFSCPLCPVLREHLEMSRDIIRRYSAYIPDWKKVMDSYQQSVLKLQTLKTEFTKMRSNNDSLRNEKFIQMGEIQEMTMRLQQRHPYQEEAGTQTEDAFDILEVPSAHVWDVDSGGSADVQLVLHDETSIVGKQSPAASRKKKRGSENVNPSHVRKAKKRNDVYAAVIQELATTEKRVKKVSPKRKNLEKANNRSSKEKGERKRKSRGSDKNGSSVSSESLAAKQQQSDSCVADDGNNGTEVSHSAEDDALFAELGFGNADDSRAPLEPLLEKLVVEPAVRPPAVPSRFQLEAIRGSPDTAAKSRRRPRKRKPRNSDHLEPHSPGDNDNIGLNMESQPELNATPVLLDLFSPVPEEWHSHPAVEEGDQIYPAERCGSERNEESAWGSDGVVFRRPLSPPALCVHGDPLYDDEAVRNLIDSSWLGSSYAVDAAVDPPDGVYFDFPDPDIEDMDVPVSLSDRSADFAFCITILDQIRTRQARVTEPEKPSDVFVFSQSDGLGPDVEEFLRDMRNFPGRPISPLLDEIIDVLGCEGDERVDLEVETILSDFRRYFCVSSRPVSPLSDEDP